jgi:hypothetical protein
MMILRVVIMLRWIEHGLTLICMLNRMRRVLYSLWIWWSVQVVGRRDRKWHKGCSERAEEGRVYILLLGTSMVCKLWSGVVGTGAWPRHSFDIMDSLTSFSSPDPFRDLDHKIGIRETWVIGFDLVQGSSGCPLHLLLVPSFDVFVQRTAPAICDIHVPIFTKVPVINHVFRTDIATKQSARSYLVIRLDICTNHCTFPQCEQVILLQP